MKRFLSYLDNRALSITEALVAAGMVGGLSLGYLQLSGDHQKSQKKIEAGFEIDMLTLEMAQTLSNDEACSETLKGVPIIKDQDVTEIKNSKGKAIFKEKKKYGQNLIMLVSMELQNRNVSTVDGFGSVELKIEFEKTAKIIKGKKDRGEDNSPGNSGKQCTNVICNPDPATRYLASEAKEMMCDSIQGDWDATTKKCKPKFVDVSCGNYITGFGADGTPECESKYSWP